MDNATNQPIVIVGGSIAGLLQGLQLKRNGKDVIVLEQDKSSNRHGHESGIQIGPSVVNLLERYDDTGRHAAIPVQGMSVGWKTRPRAFNIASPRQMSNWGYLYQILRTNFDGLKSESIPTPPVPRDGDGHVQYRQGKRVIGFRYDEVTEIVHVRFVDVVSGEEDGIDTSLVIAADGVHSTTRSLLNATVRREYGGYIAWRGTVPERILSNETIDFFSDRLNFTLMQGTYAISYFVPTEDGDMDKGQRLLNWAWYYVVPEDSPEMRSIFTDVDGKTHSNTVPQGLVKPDLWLKQVETFLPRMTEPFAEVIRKTPSPFVTKVIEAESIKKSFHDGHVVLVGDAFTAFRSHMGLSSEQAARHCLQLDKIRQGEMDLKQWKREATFYAQKLLILNRMVGHAGLGSYLEVLRWVRDFCGC